MVFLNTINNNVTNIYIVGLVLIIICAITFLTAIIFRVARMRFWCRLFMLIGSIILVAYTSLVFVNLPLNDWGYKDTSEIILFVISIIIFLYNLIVFVKKR